METKIKFPSNITFTGRNGTFAASGVVLVHGDKWHLQMFPITSKGKEARCEIQIHHDSIPEFIASLSLQACEAIPPIVSEPTYVLFGEEAVRIFNEDGFKGFKKAVNKDGLGYAIEEFPATTPPADVLSASDGWHDFAILTKDEYLKLQKL